MFITTENSTLMYIKFVQHSKVGRYSEMHRGDIADAMHGNQPTQLYPALAHTHLKPLHTPTHVYKI